MSLTKKKIKKMKDENETLKKENEDLKIRLKKYTSPARYKKYYEKNKDKLLEKNKEYKKSIGYKSKVSKEKQHEYYETYKKKKMLT